MSAGCWGLQRNTCCIYLVYIWGTSCLGSYLNLEYTLQ